MNLIPPSVSKQLLINQICNKHLNTDVSNCIKEFCFETVVNVSITNEAKRKKRLLHCEQAATIDEWYFAPGLNPEDKWGVCIQFGDTPYQISDRAEYYPHYTVIAGANCSKCGNYLHVESLGMTQLPVRIICFCHALDEWSMEHDQLTMYDEYGQEEDWDW